MPNSRAIKLLQITDTHLVGKRDGVLRGIHPFATLQAVQAHARAYLKTCDGVLLTGDLVQDDAAGYALIEEAFRNSSVPVYCLPGNHDLPDAMRQTLAGAPFVHDDHVIMPGWLIIMLNSWQADSAGGSLGTAQLQRMVELLQQHAHLHTLICLHHHPVPMHSEWLDQVGLSDAAALQACIAQHAQVRGVVWGHVHQCYDEMINDVRYMATPATCTQFKPHSREFAVDHKPPGYRTLLLNSDGSIDTEVVWAR